jgi:hypothetical protein
LSADVVFFTEAPGGHLFHLIFPPKRVKNKKYFCAENPIESGVDGGADYCWQSSAYANGWVFAITLPVRGKPMNGG